MQTCTKCNIIKNVEDFSIQRASKSGRQTHCKMCLSKYGSQWHQTKIGRFQAYKRYAKIRSLSFELTFEKFLSFWDKPCVYCGTIINGVGIDRINNTIGYTIANVCACCKWCNRMKMNYTNEEFITQCIKIVKHVT